MKIKSVTIKNFRAYKNEVTIEFDDLTAFVGRNDIGKTTILEALDIFINDAAASVKIEANDLNIDAAEDDNPMVEIAVEFVDLPSEIILDALNRTTLSDEYLLSVDGTLKIKKYYLGGKMQKVCIIANYPLDEHCKDLLSNKNIALKKILDVQNISCDDRTRNAVIRAAIFNHYGYPNGNNTGYEEMEIDVSKEDAKQIYTQLSSFLPIYSLFHADRPNNDTDSEIQDPMKLAVKQIMQDDGVVEMCNAIAARVTQELERVASDTMEKLNSLNNQIANTLTPNIPSLAALKWADVFKTVSITSDNQIPMNKRGSGVKRLVLLSFFMAEVEKRKMNPTNTSRGVIYAIEEPETSQHINMQKQMIDSLISLSKNTDIQVILTTHSSFVVKQLEKENIRLITDINGTRCVIKPKEQIMPYLSLNEINYTNFLDASVEYHNELFGYIQSKAIEDSKENSKEKPFDNWLVGRGMKKTLKWTRNNDKRETYEVTLQLFIRNTIHHPENKSNRMYKYDELSQSIEEMRQFIRNGFQVKEDSSAI
jgi:predicted ATP-dependent endonuclease of OLD family